MIWAKLRRTFRIELFHEAVKYIANIVEKGKKKVLFLAF